MGKKEFGFYPKPLQITAGPVTVSPLPELEQTINDILASDGVEKDWFYAPLQQGGEGWELPYPSRVFGLPKTHVIEHATATSEDHLDFHLWALSFFVGMRLTATEGGFLDATPLRPGELVNFVLLGSSLTRAIELADDFWMTNLAEPLRAQRFAAAVHALFIAQNPQNLQFERFVYFYTAIDACYKLTESLRPSVVSPKSHNERIEWLCQQFGIVMPSWADPAVSGGAEVAGIRNNAAVAVPAIRHCNALVG